MKQIFDLYLEEQLKDPAFAERFEKAGEAWDVALQIASLREKAGLSNATSPGNSRPPANISRLESPAYEGHSLTMLRRVAEILGATVRVTLAPKGESKSMVLSEAKVPYRTGRSDETTHNEFLSVRTGGVADGVDGIGSPQLWHRR